MLVGIVGLKRSGKNAIAEYLKSNHDFHIYAFAQPLKEACKILFGFSDEQLNGNFKEIIDPRYDTTPRKIIQVFGTEMFQYDLPKHIPEIEKKMGRNFWTYKFQCWYEQELIHNKNINVCVSDVRFLHEEKIIKLYGGQIWRINRKGLLDNDTHPSENEWKIIKPKHIIENNGTIIELHKKIDKILK